MSDGTDLVDGRKREISWTDLRIWSAGDAVSDKPVGSWEDAN